MRSGFLSREEREEMAVFLSDVRGFNQKEDLMVEAEVEVEV